MKRINLVNLLITLCCVLFFMDIKAQDENNAGKESGKFANYFNSVETVRKGEPLPELQIPLFEPNIEFMYPVGQDYLLIGTVKQKKYGFAIHGPLIYFNINTGEELWRFARDPDMNTNYTILETEPDIIISELNRKAHKLFAINSTTGEEMWDYTENDSLHYSVFSEYKAIAIVNQVKNKKYIKILSIDDGSIIWEKRVDNIGIDRLTKIELIFDQIWLIGEGTNAYYIKNGDLLWSNDEIRTLSPKSHPYIMMKDEILVGAEDSVMIKINRKGEILWKVILPEIIGIMCTHNDMLIVNVEDAITKHYTDWIHKTWFYKIMALSLSDGSIMWEKKLSDPLLSRFLIKDDLIYLVEGDTLSQYNVHTGEVLHQKKLNCEDNRLADRFISYSDHLILIHEDGIGAYDWQDLHEIWYFHIDGVKPTLESTIDLWFHEGLFDLFSKEKQITDIFSSPVSNSKSYYNMKETALIYAGKIKNKQEFTYDLSIDYNWYDDQQKMIHDQLISDLDRDYEEGRISASSYSSRFSYMVNFERSMASTRLLASSIGAAIEIKKAADALEKELRKEEWQKVIQFDFSYLTFSHFSSSYGDYFIKPFSRLSDLVPDPGRCGFIIVNMRNGEWCEVSTTFGDTKRSRIIEIDIEPASFTLDGKSILIRGVGLEPSYWKEGLAFGDEIAEEPSYSILKYNMEDLQFNKTDTYKDRYKHLYGNYFDVESRFSEFKPKKTRTEDALTLLGQPDYFKGDRYYWGFAAEINGTLNFDGITCIFDKSGKLKSSWRHCSPKRFNLETKKFECDFCDEFKQFEKRNKRN